MKKTMLIKLGATALVLIMAVVCLASCSSKANDSYDAENMFPSEDSAMGESGSSVPKGDYVTDDSLADKNEGENSGEQGEEVYQPKIIRNVKMNAETRDFDTAIAEIEASVARLGGYVESCNVRNAQTSYRGDTVTERNADYVLRIPAEALDGFLAETGALLNVTSTSSSAEDISGEYYDIQARISVLETEKQLLEKMLSESDSVDTMLTLERRLYDVIYEIESYKTAIKVYDSKVAYSTVTLTVQEVAELTEADEEKTFWQEITEATGESWEITVDIFQFFVIFGIYLVPFALFATVGFAIPAVVILVIVLIVVKVIRRRIKKAKELK